MRGVVRREAAGIDERERGAAPRALELLCRRAVLSSPVRSRTRPRSSRMVAWYLAFSSSAAARSLARRLTSLRCAFRSGDSSASAAYDRALSRSRSFRRTFTSR